MGLKHAKNVGKRGKDKTERKRGGYYLRYSNYLTDPETIIPHGRPVRASADARWLWRQDCSFVGIVSRSVVANGYFRKHINAHWTSSCSFDVIVEVSQEDLKKLNTIKILGVSLNELDVLLRNAKGEAEKLAGKAEKGL